MVFIVFQYESEPLTAENVPYGPTISFLVAYLRVFDVEFGVAFASFAASTLPEILFFDFLTSYDSPNITLSISSVYIP